MVNHFSLENTMIRCEHQVADVGGISERVGPTVFVIQQTYLVENGMHFVGIGQKIISTPTISSPYNWMAISHRCIPPCMTTPLLCTEKAIIESSYVQGCVVVCGVTSPSHCVWHRQIESLGIEG